MANASSNFAAAASWSPGITWEYVSIVMLMSACPSRSWTTLGLSPSLSISVGVRVSETVKVGIGQIGFGGHLAESVRQTVRQHRPSVGPGEDEVIEVERVTLTLPESCLALSITDGSCSRR